MTPPKETHPSVDALEFELTDFATAREALDELPSGIGRSPTLTPGYWEQRRRKLLPRDRALAGPTIDWLLSLPPAQRPRALCERYPRLANAIAEVWALPDARAQLLNALLADERGGRRGFALEVRREIEALQAVPPADRGDA